MRQSHRLISNALANVAGQLAMLLPGFVVPPFVISRIGIEGYGAIVVVTSVLGFVGLVNLGMPEALSRFLAVQQTRGDTEGLSRVLSTGVATVGSASIVAALAVLLVAVRPDWFVAETDGVPLATLRAVVLVLGTATVLSVAAALGYAAFYALEKFGVLNLLRTGESLLRLLMVLLLVGPLNAGLLGYASANAIALVASSAAVLLFGLRRMPHARVRRARVQLATFKRMVGFGGEVLLNRLGFMLYVQVDYLIIGRAFGPAMVTYFSLAMVWSQVVRGIVGAAVAVAVPASAIRQEMGDVASLRMMVVRSAKYGLVMSVAPLVFLMVFRRSLLETWMGPGYETTAQLMLILLAADFLVAAAMGPVQVFIGRGDIRFITVTNLIFGALNAALAVYLGVVLELELWGIATAYLVIFGLRFGIVLPTYMARRLELGTLAFLRASYLRPILSALLLAPVAGLVHDAELASGWAGLLSSAALVGAAYLPIAWFVACDGYDRTLVRELAVTAASGLRRGS